MRLTAQGGPPSPHFGSSGLIEAEDDQDAGLTNRVGATRSVAEAIMAGMGALRRLDPLMRNKYRSDPVKLAEWFTSSPPGLAAFSWVSTGQQGPRSLSG